jgi:hypothetical protein
LFNGSKSNASDLEFGVIPKEDLALKDYAPDPGAPAFVLENHGTYYLEYNSGFEIVEKRHVRIKILKPTGYHHGDVEIYYPGKLEKFKASTYNLVNGEILETELDKDEIFDELNDVYYNVRRFSFPKVKKGSVLEYTYITRYENISTMPTWYFQEMIPVRESRLKVEFPEQFTYRIVVEGTEKVLSDQVMAQAHFLGKYSTYRIHTMVAKEVPAFELESFMDSYKNYFTKADIQLVRVEFQGYSTNQFLTSYEKINEKLLEDSDFGGMLKSSYSTRKIVKDITRGINDPEKKMIAIHGYVRDNLHWNEKKKVFGSKKFNALLFDKIGNAADINLFMVQLFRDAGLDAQPVVLSTFDNGRLNKVYANPRQLNYTIAMVKIGDEQHLLDGTNKLSPWNRLPKRCLNGEGWIVKEGTGKWIPLKNNEEGKTKLLAHLKLAGNGKIDGQITVLYHGLSADDERKILDYYGFEKYSNRMQDIYGEWVINEHSFENVDSLDKHLVEKWNMSLTGETIITGNYMYINPVVIMKDEINYFYQEERKHPVNFGYPRTEYFLMNLQIPTTLEIEELPESAIIKLPDNKGEYTFRISGKGNIIQVLSQLEINEPFFKVDDYKYLHDMYNHIIEKQSEMIVLKKKRDKVETDTKISTIN